MTETPWWWRTACDWNDMDKFFPHDGETFAEAKKLCDICPVKLECLTEALEEEHGSCFGMRGGLTPTERQKLRGDKPRHWTSPVFVAHRSGKGRRSAS